MQGQSKFEQFEAHQRVFNDRDLQLNISFSVKDGHKFSEQQKHYLDGRNHSIKMILEQRQYVLNAYIATKNEDCWRFVRLCDEQILKILGIPTLEEMLIPINHELHLQKQLDLVAHLKAEMLQSLKIPQEYFNDSEIIIVPTAYADTNEC